MGCIDDGRLTRRHVILRGLGAGLSMAGLGALLAACGGGAPPAPSVGPASSAAGTAPAVSSSAAAPTKGGAMVVGLDQEPPTLDPHASPSAITYFITNSVFEMLTYRDPSGKLNPWLAESWEAAPDSKSFTFKLRKDVKFSDGTPFNGEAVKANFDRIVDPKFKAGGSLSSLRGYDGTTVVNEFEVKVNFKEPFSPFLVYSAGGTLGMVSPKAFKEMGDAINQKPVGSGPFVVKEYVAKDHATITSNPAYTRKAPWSDHEGPPYLDQITFKFIPENATRAATVESGETHAVDFVQPQDLARLQGNNKITIMKVPWTGAPRQWNLNVKLAPTDDVKVRQALNYAISREALMATVFKGTANPGQAPLVSTMLSDPSLKNPYPFDQAKARALLDEAGWKEGPDKIRVKDGKRLELVINSIDYGGGADPPTQFVQAQLRDVGVDAKIKAQARPPYYEDNYHCATNGPIMFLRSSDWDGLYALYGTKNIGGNFNWSCYSNPKVDDLLAKGVAESDPEKRKAIYVEVEKILMQDAVVVPLAEELSVWALTARASGLKFDYTAYPLWSDVSLAK